MPNFKISVSKENKRYTIIFKAENEAVARDRVHQEWYSVLGVEEISAVESVWNIFIFEAYKNWQIKHWKIAWDDIFKVYVNLVRNLEYDVFSIYNEKDKDLPIEKKEKILKELKEEYAFLQKWKRQDKLDELREKIKKEKGEALNLNQFYLKKELEDTNKLIVHVLKKLESMILWNSAVKLTQEQKIKFEAIYNSIIKLKKSTNISKLKEIWEVALQKIWKIELSQLEDTKDEQNRELLKETNKLLKELGSKDRFIEKDRDLWYQFKQFIDYLKTFLEKKEEENKENVEVIDKESHTYNRTKVILSKYEEKLVENNIFILKNLFKILSDSDLRELTFLKRSILKQNIFLLKSRLKWKVVSYVLISKWIFGFFWFFTQTLEFLRKNLFYIMFIYSLIFLFSFSFNLEINFNWLLFFIYLSFIYILLSLSKNLFFLVLEFALFWFIVILWVINF